MKLEVNKEIIRVSKTMSVLESKDKKTQYIIIKIGDKVYSTEFSDLEGNNIFSSKEQITDTKGVGIQQNIWIKGNFTETKNHEKIEKLPFEMNIYSKLLD